MAEVVVPAPALRTGRDASRFGLAVLTLLALALLAPHAPVRWGLLGWLDANTARATAALAHLVGLEVKAEGYSIVHPAGFACEVYYRCTGLLPAAFLAGAIFASPAGLRRRWWGAGAGVLVVLLVNLLRLVGLVAVGIHWPGAFGIFHTLVSSVILVTSVAGFWFLWARRALVPPGPA